MSQIVYNGVSLDFPFTRGLDSRPAWTPDGADYLGTDHVLRVQGVVHGADGAAAAAEYDRIRHALEQPRKRLLYTTDGGVILESDAKLDLVNGPHPELVSIDQIVGTVSFNVSFTLKTRLWGCGKPPTYLSNRWDEEVTIGPDHLTRVVRTGTLFTRASMATVDTDAARGVVTPPLGKIFNRQQAVYKIRSDMMALSYTFVDQEVEAQPPSPAIRIDDATYTESCPDGAKRYGDVRVALTGRPRGDRKALLATAIMICVRRLQAAGAMLPGTASLTTMVLSEKMHQNRVSVQMRSILAAAVKPSFPKQAGRTMVLSWIGTITGVGPFTLVAIDSLLRPSDAPIPKVPQDLAGYGEPLPGSDPTSVPDPTLRGAAGLVMVAAALNDPCLAQSAGITELRAGDTTLASAKPDGYTSAPSRTVAPPSAPPPAPTVSIVDTIIGAASAIVGGLAPPGVYTDSRVSCRWEGDEQIAHMAPTDSQGVSAFVALAAPTRQLVVEYTAERIGGRPQIPPRDLGSNYVLLAEDKSPAQIDVGADGVTPVLRVSGSRVYGVRDPSKVVEGAIPPWEVEQLRALLATQAAGESRSIEAILRMASEAGAGVEERGMLPWLT